MRDRIYVMGAKNAKQYNKMLQSVILIYQTYSFYKWKKIKNNYFFSFLLNCKEREERKGTLWLFGNPFRAKCIIAFMLWVLKMLNNIIKCYSRLYWFIKLTHYISERKLKMMTVSCFCLIVKGREERKENLWILGNLFRAKCTNEFMLWVLKMQNNVIKCYSRSYWLPDILII
jgi:hypothetical protein